MLENSYEELKEKKNLRENLSMLRGALKETEAKIKLRELAGDGSILLELLMDEEPKVRKNAALLLGDLELLNAAAPLLAAYRQETKLFVKSSYLSALGKLSVNEYLPVFKDRLRTLTAIEPAESEKKHINEEIRELEKIITGAEGISHHTFSGFQKEHKMLLTVSHKQRDAVLRELIECSPTVRRKVELHPLGVLVTSGEVLPFIRLRTYREFLFPIHSREKIEQKPEAAAKAVFQSDLLVFLEECHQQKVPFYFRLELKSRMELDKKSSFAKKFAAELERLSGRRLINSTKDYEVEIRLIETREGTMIPFLKLSTLPSTRFSYRRNVISASIHPASAALLVQLSMPYLKENAQILDPFCGVGTMLIERDIRVPAREKYGIDIYGEAIEKARENTALSGTLIHYIHRDYFDFKHDYRFDEIITNMPVKGRRSKEEMDDFYGQFFEKSKSILAADGIIILYSNEAGFVKKQIRLHAEYKLLQEFCIREKDHFYLFIIGIRGNKNGIFN